MIARRALVAALAQRRVADWVLVERTRACAVVETADAGRGAAARTELRTRATLLVHHDVPQGRGSARVELGARDDDAAAVVARALALAELAVGPTWRSPPAAAPARVALLDPALAEDRTPDALAARATAALASLRRPSGVTAALSLALSREDVHLERRGGQRAGWTESRAAAAGWVARGAHALPLAREERALAALGLDAALAEAAAELPRLAEAAPPTPGRFALILRAEALLHGGLGVWRVLADQARAEVERQGLTRLRPGAPLAPGADERPAPLTVTSDGALDLGLASAPLDDDAGAVRRFALIERGVTAGLGLTPREAARRGREPNGGVRNLVVTPGTWDGAPPPGRTLDVLRLASLDLEPHTGEAVLEIALALERDGGAARPVTGATVRLDLVEALAAAERTEAILRRGAYVGPAAIAIADARVER